MTISVSFTVTGCVTFGTEVAGILEVRQGRGTGGSLLQDRPPPFLSTVPHTHVVQSFSALSNFSAHVGKFEFSCPVARLQGTAILLSSSVLLMLLVCTQHAVK